MEKEIRECATSTRYKKHCTRQWENHSCTTLEQLNMKVIQE